MPVNTTIILASFNGAHYIDEQLNSIEREVAEPVNILICDDKSYDSTLNIINDYIKRSKHNVSLQINKKNLGPTKTFINLLKCVETEYVVFCDQDDIWIADRVQLTEHSASDILVSKFEVFEGVNTDHRKKHKLPNPSLRHGVLFPRFPGCCLSGRTDFIRSLYTKHEYISLYDWILVSRGVLLGARFKLTNETCFLYRRHAGTVTKMGHSPDGILKALKRRYNLFIDLCGSVKLGKR